MISRTRSTMRGIMIGFLAGVFVLAAFISGCKKNDSNPLGTSTSVSDNDADVADAVSDALASNNGGAMDQVNDVFEIAGGVGVGSTLGKTQADSNSTQLRFSDSDTAWYLSVYRSRGSSYWSRDYWHQFIGASGKAQKARVGAVLIHHKLQDGSGHFQTLRLIHDLTSIHSDWFASINPDTTVTINGTYQRTGRDSITVLVGPRKGSLLVDTLSMTFTNVTGPKRARYLHSEKTSGTIDIVYSATITAPGKSTVYIRKEFTVSLGGGIAHFSIDGSDVNAALDTGDH